MRLSVVAFLALSHAELLCWRNSVPHRTSIKSDIWDLHSEFQCDFVVGI